MIERAVLQEVVVSRDGSITQRVAPRPDSVRAIAERMNHWRDRPEFCATCRKDHAVGMRGGLPLCAGCRAQETRFLEATHPLASRMVRDDDYSDRLEGYAIVFGQLSLDLGGFQERILPSAVHRTLRGGDDVRSLWNHDTGIILGRSSAGTLVVRADKVGLWAGTTPPSWAAGYVESVDRRDVTGQSFGFRVLEDEWHMEDGIPTREVVDMVFSEVSATPFPAYPMTTLRVGAQRSVRAEQAQRWHQLKASR